jgi:hypothetical protein
MPAIENSMGAVLLGVVEGNSMFKVLLGRGKLSKNERGNPQRMVGLQEKSRVLHELGHGEEPLSQLVRRL